ncbi:MAG TPA: LacI family DNA-binding transcriptional regulator [Limnochordales bacterium]|uniref:LacI family DNA-binding transcriptional regulator n=1 Tax=Geochorda subterranea TaxID=3109564 RepID=A0ABZ1BLP5_9FIRM|nr:LacI family DNA-binding transcriptional regulator [Limnochorda sp. LNt]NLG70265.1 LacI family transcriptional regulator [Bacillota bacterium]WRP13669.1 LacI family DNA-binding transcriptional regulator [Limnochorda sp. LNt]
MPGVRDIARIAGVSPATVSRVLNGNPRVSPELRRQVERAAAQLGYRTSRLRRPPSRSRVVALLVPHVSSPFYAAVIGGVEGEAFANGYDLMLYTTEGRSHQDVVERVLMADHACGLVVITPRHGEDVALADRSPRLPVVVVDHRNTGSRHPHVGVDNLRGAYNAVRYLLSRGYERVAMITGPTNIQSAVDRIRGYRLALEEAGIAFDPELVWQGDFNQPSGYDAVARWLDAGKEPPRAIFCSNDLMALGAMTALHERGIAVPERVAVMGYDDLYFAATSVPPLTTVRQPIAEMGAIAFRMVTRLARGERLDTERVLLETELVVRGSA